MLKNNNILKGGSQGYKLLNRGENDLFDVKQTYIGKENAGKHGSRYISVNKEPNENYSHHLQIENLK